jgi:hypothetical protein
MIMSDWRIRDVLVSTVTKLPLELEAITTPLFDEVLKLLPENWLE